MRRFRPSTPRCPRIVPGSPRWCIPVSSDHPVRPTNADPHLIDLPLFGQPLPNGAAAVSSIPAEPLTTLGSTRPDVDWTLVASLRSLASKQLSQAVASATTRLDKTAQAELGRAIVLDLIESAMAEREIGREHVCTPD